MSYPPPSSVISAAKPGVPAPRLLDEVRRRLRLKHCSLRTEAIYVGWICRFILANGKRHPREMGAVEVEGFLSGLAVRGGVAASTQNQALSKQGSVWTFPGWRQNSFPEPIASLLESAALHHQHRQQFVLPFGVPAPSHAGAQLAVHEELLHVTVEIALA